MKHTHPAAYAVFKELEINTSLQDIYDRVPEGSCKGCTRCCSESVNTFFSEYLALRQQLEEQGERVIFEAACIRYYLTELVEAMKCPLLRADGRCAVYQSRPLPCRVFGHLRKEDYASNYDEILSSNREMAEALEFQLAIKVPDEVIFRQIPFCEDFTSAEPMSLEDRDELIDDLFLLDSRLLAKGVMGFDDINLSLVQWFAYDHFGRELAEQLRIKVGQEYSESGFSETLRKTMESLNG